MRAGLAVAPRWVQSVALGVFFGFWFAVSYRAWGEDWGSVIFAGLVGAVIFGAIVHRIEFTRDRGLRARLVPLDPAQRRHAVRAAHRGPLPGDPAVRNAALYVACFDLARHEENARITGIILAAGTVAAAVAAIVTPSVWWAIVAVPLAGSLIAHIWRGQSLPGRIDRLRASGATASR